jgi:hypothetical protein
MRKVLVIGSVSLSMVSSTWCLHGQTPADQPRTPSRSASLPATAPAGQGDALKAADAWLKLIDATDFKTAALGMADETKALFHWPTEEERILAITVLLGQPRAKGVTMNFKFTRTLEPGSVKQVSSCPCGTRSGNYYVMTYDYASSWLFPNHEGASRRGMDTLYMLQEPDGSWKPAALFWLAQK